MPYRTPHSPRRRQLLLAGAAVAASAGAPAQTLDLAEAVNQAGRQRMLSQRMAKAWLALATPVLPERARAVLDDSAALFERQLAALRGFGGSAAVLSTLQQLEAAWADYRQRLLTTPPALGAAAALLQADGRVLALAHQATQQLEALSSRPTGRLINLAGRQRMLSQRMAKYRLAAAQPALAEEAQAQIRQARQEFLQALDELERAPQATRAIHDEIALARGQWVFYDLAQIGRAHV
jgi:nitrate/nitrite-specific signal transduction histidine kinase